MKALVVHNRYSSRVPSGENLAVDDEVRWLGDAGVEVHRYGSSNDELLAPGPAARVRAGVGAIWSKPARRDFAGVLAAVQPDVVHLHNLFPLLSASVAAEAVRFGAPVVWTAHNRRLTCVAGSHFRNGLPCYDCRPGWRLPGIVHGCYAGSVAASGLVTAATSIFGTLARRHVTALAISDYMKQWLVASGGFDPSSVVVKHSAVDGPGSAPPPPAGRADIVFLGRLTPIKGIDLMLDAWRRTSGDGRPDGRLRIIGDGDLAASVQAAAADDGRIDWRGAVPTSDVSAHLADARAVIVPSTCDETFGRVTAEAFAHGRPVITTGQGALSEIVDETTGWVTGTDPEAMATALRAATRRDAEGDATVAQRGAAARARYDERYSPEATTRRLIEIYESAIAGAASATSVGSPRRH